MNTKVSSEIQRQLHLAHKDNLGIDGKPLVFQAQQKIDTRVRLTIIEQLYHQVPEEEAQSYRVTYTRLINSDEQPFSRYITLKENEKIPLDCGWVESPPSLVIIENLAGKNLLQIPTEEEKEEITQQVIHVLFGESEKGIIIRPGEFLKMEPEDTDSIYLLSPKKTKINLTVFPS